MKKHLILQCWLAVASALSAQDIDVSGTVTDRAGHAVSGALVTLENSGLSDTTGADGSFRLFLVSTSLRQVPDSPVPRLSSGRRELSVFLPGRRRVCVELRDSEGRLAQIYADGFWNRGFQSIALAGPAAGDGLYILAVRIGNELYALQAAVINGHWHLSGPAAEMPGSRALTKSAAGFPDVLTVYHPDYDSAFSEVAAPVSMVNVVLKRRAQVWKLLLIVKKETDVVLEGWPAVHTSIPDDNIAAVTESFTQHFPWWIDTLTEGRLKLETEVVLSPRPLDRVSPVGEGNWPAPQDMADDIAEFTAMGQYDGIFVYWRSGDGAGADVNGGWGWTIGGGISSLANYSGWATVNYHADNTNWTSQQDPIHEVFIHEWMHQLEGFYGSLGVQQPEGGLHSAVDHGYVPNVWGDWKDWYYDYFLRQISEGDTAMVGFGEPAWSLGTIRRWALIHSPEFLTEEVLGRNLLANGSFEEADFSGAVGDWTFEAWQAGSSAGIRDTAAGHGGRSSLRIDNTAENDARLIQVISVEPDRYYVLAGWIKTEGVAASGNTGANICLLPGFAQSSPQRTGTEDWGYVSLVFHSDTNTSVTIGARLGFFGSTAAGTAWFDDLVLVEL